MLKTTYLDIYDIAPCILWVEDELTRIWLTELWADPRIRVISGAGRQGVEFLVHAAPSQIRGTTVVGLVDCDFSTPNRTKWSHSTEVVLRTDVHEFENYLLDFELFGEVAREGSNAVKQIARNYAKTIQWWMTCKHVLHELRASLASEFPPDPKLGTISNQNDALLHISNDPFWGKHDAGRRNWDPNGKYLIGRLLANYQQYEDDLNDPKDRWTRTFSGKEIFRHIRTNVGGLRKFAEREQSPAQNDMDLARRMVRALRRPDFEKSATKLLFDELHDALCTRARL